MRINRKPETRNTLRESHILNKEENAKSLNNEKENSSKHIDFAKKRNNLVAKKSGKHKSPNNKHTKTLKIAIPVIVIALLLVLFVIIKQNTNVFNSEPTAEQQSLENGNSQGIDTQAEENGEKEESQITEEDIEVGKNGYISSVQITQRATGTGPWDENDEPGNDSSPDNDIVRSFDQVTWTVNLITSLKQQDAETSYTGGVVEFTATLPEEFAKTEYAPYMEWDLESMQWIEDANLSEDGITLNGKYSLSETDRTVPGAQTLVFVLKLYGVANNKEFAPTFTFNLAGNEVEDKTTITDSKIKVSATGKYNIQLGNNTSYLSTKATVNYGQGETSGRMYGYGFAVQLYNDNESKGLKGIEYPQGEISFDIDLKLERTKFGSDELEDITSEALPILWNYRVNNWDVDDLSGNIADRNMYYFTGNTIYCRSLPLGQYIDDNSPFKTSDYSVFNSGNIKIVQEANTLHITINNYAFNGIFPMYESGWSGSNTRTKKYTNNIGTFSVGYMQIFVPDTEANTIKDRNYYLTILDNNMNIKFSIQTINTQGDISDDSIRTQHFIYKKGSYYQAIELYDKNFSNYI